MIIVAVKPVVDRGFTSDLRGLSCFVRNAPEEWSSECLDRLYRVPHDLGLWDIGISFIPQFTVLWLHLFSLEYKTLNWISVAFRLHRTKKNIYFLRIRVNSDILDSRLFFTELFQEQYFSISRKHIYENGKILSGSKQKHVIAIHVYIFLVLL